MIKIAITTFLLLQAASTLGQDVYSEQFQRIQSIELYEIDDVSNEEKLIEKRSIPNELKSLTKRNNLKSVNAGGIIMMTRELIALGKQIYKVIEAGKPVVNVNSEPISVLPRTEEGATVSAFELSNWSMPKVKKYKVVTKNYLGMKPASFEFMLIYTYGGDYDGKGKYINSAQIKPTQINVKWGYSLDVNFSVQSIINQGSRTNPLAGVVLQLDYKISTVLQEMQNSKTFYINGLGQTKEY